MILFKNNSLAAILFAAKVEIYAIVDIYSLPAMLKLNHNIFCQIDILILKTK